MLVVLFEATSGSDGLHQFHHGGMIDDAGKVHVDTTTGGRRADDPHLAGVDERRGRGESVRVVFGCHPTQNEKEGGIYHSRMACMVVVYY